MDPRQKLSEALDLLTEALTECGLDSAVILVTPDDAQLISIASVDAPIIRQVLGGGEDA
jgi:hypothetical protein